MYLPLGLNTPILLGAFIAYLVKKSSKDKELAELRSKRGTLIASGLIAGGALIGVIGALIKYFGMVMIWMAIHLLMEFICIKL